MVKAKVNAKERQKVILMVNATEKVKENVRER